MFRRRDEEENSLPNAVENAYSAQPQNPQQNVTAINSLQPKNNESYGLTTPANQTNSSPQTQQLTQSKNMSSSSFTEVTPKQTTYKLTPNGASFVNQDAPNTATPAATTAPAPAQAAPAAVSIPSPATVSKAPTPINLTPRFDNIEAERRLTVGYGISLEGKVSDCDKLIIYGSVKAELNNVKTLHISESGKFTGSASIENAEISGIFEGEIKVSKNIVINSTGRVSGKITYGSIEVKPGGKFTGEVCEAKTPTAESAAPAPAAPEAKTMAEEKAA